MFEFINKNEEIDALVNRTIVEEFDYVNKISFLHSAVRKYFPEIYQDNLNGLSEPFSKLLELKETYEREVGKSLNEPSYSVLNIGGFLDSIIGDHVPYGYRGVGSNNRQSLYLLAFIIFNTSILKNYNI